MLAEGPEAFDKISLSNLSDRFCREARERRHHNFVRLSVSALFASSGAGDVIYVASCEVHSFARTEEELTMAWTTPVTTEICVGMEVTSYASAKI